jgi:hypothetical protein
LVACLPATGSFEVALENQSSLARIAMVELLVQGQVVPRYFVSDARTMTVLDTVGHDNGPPEAVVIFDESCAELERVDRDFQLGALIILTSDGGTHVELGRESTTHRTGIDQDYGESSCEAAAAALH